MNIMNNAVATGRLIRDPEIRCNRDGSRHVRFTLVSIPPKYSIFSFMGYLKGKSALMIFDKHANLKYKFGNRHFWSEGYYVSTVGLNEATIRKYIQEQERHDIMQDISRIIFLVMIFSYLTRGKADFILIR